MANLLNSVIDLNYKIALIRHMFHGQFFNTYLQMALQYEYKIPYREIG
jgi:hypothetical protein